MRGNRNALQPRSHSRSVTGRAARFPKRHGQSQKGLLRAEVLEPRQLLSATFTVNSVTDDPSGPTSGIPSGRDQRMNASAGDSSSNPDAINFNITGSPTIALSADLPALLNPAHRWKFAGGRHRQRRRFCDARGSIDGVAQGGDIHQRIVDGQRRSA